MAQHWHGDNKGRGGGGKGQGQQGGGGQGCPVCKGKIFTDKKNTDTDKEAKRVCSQCGWYIGMSFCREHNVWLKPNETCKHCTNNRTRETKLEKEKFDREKTHTRCPNCHLTYDVKIGGCPVCTIECSNISCKLRYPKTLLQCPRCVLQRTYELKVDRDEDKITRKWELHFTFFETIGNEAPRAIGAKFRLNDPESAADDIDIPATGSTKKIPYAPTTRDLTYTLIGSDAGVVNAQVPITRLSGKPPKFHKTQPVAGNSFLKDFMRALKGE